MDYVRELYASPLQSLGVKTNCRFIRYEMYRKIAGNLLSYEEDFPLFFHSMGSVDSKANFNNFDHLISKLVLTLI